jgi:hypothetical protein
VSIALGRLSDGLEQRVFSRAAHLDGKARPLGPTDTVIPSPGCCKYPHLSAPSIGRIRRRRCLRIPPPGMWHTAASCSAGCNYFGWCMRRRGSQVVRSQYQHLGVEHGAQSVREGGGGAILRGRGRHLKGDNKGTQGDPP